MKWLARSLWLAAWSFWAWLGFGLYRELPRSYGPMLSRLNVGDRGRLLGFVGDESRFAIANVKADGSAKFELVDVESSRVLLSTPTLSDAKFLLDNRKSGENGTVLCDRIPTFDENRWTGGLFILDFPSGEWRRRYSHETLLSMIHDERPWVLMRVWLKDRTQSVTIIDFETGKEVFSRTLPSSTGFDGHPVFGPGSDDLLFSVADFDDDRKKSIEIWSIKTQVLKKRIDGVSLESPYAVSRTGRVASNISSEDDAVDVYDLNTSEFLFSDPPQNKRKKQQPWGLQFTFTRPRPTLSESGQRLLWAKENELLDLDTGSIVWAGRNHERCTLSDLNGSFVVTEYWTMLWSDWLPRFWYVTRAYRNLETGALQFRTAEDADEPPGIHRETFRSGDGRITVNADGIAYRLPFRINYPVLALCQAILALPLVLLWTILKWRRNRRLRLASVQS